MAAKKDTNDKNYYTAIAEVHELNDTWSSSNINLLLKRQNKKLFVMLEGMRHYEIWWKLREANRKYLK